MIRKFPLAALSILLCQQSALARDDVQSPNMLTQGVVQMTIKVGQTSQYEVLQTFGGPNISTVDGSGNEVWVYDRQATVSYERSSGFSIGMLIG